MCPDGRVSVRTEVPLGESAGWQAWDGLEAGFKRQQTGSACGIGAGVTRARGVRAHVGASRSTSDAAAISGPQPRDIGGATRGNGLGPTSDTANYAVAYRVAHTATGARGKMPTDTTLVTLSKPLSVSCGVTCMRWCGTYASYGCYDSTSCIPTAVDQGTDTT
jgi:hypothetical protein